MSKRKVGRPTSAPTIAYTLRIEAAFIDRLEKRYGKKMRYILTEKMKELDNE